MGFQLVPPQNSGRRDAYRPHSQDGCAPPPFHRVLTEDTIKEYDVRFDAPIEPVVFSRTLNIHGSLIHRAGKPIHGIRIVVSRRLTRTKTVRARRKRNRPEVAIAYPAYPDSLATGFLFELQLGFGRNQLTFEVQDHNRVWRTFRSVSVFVLPSSILTTPKFRNLRRSLELYFKDRTDRETKVPPQPSLFNGLPLSSSRENSERNSKIASRTRVRLFATSRSNLFIVEIGQLVAGGFRAIGCDVELLIDQIPEEHPSPDVLQIVVTPHEFYNLFLREKFSRPRLRKLTRGVILLCTEQPETHWFHNNLSWTFHARGVADISALGAAAYRLRGIRCHHLQLGYDPMLAHEPVPPHTDRSIDIAFLGSLTPKREAFFSEHADFFSEHACHLRLVPLGFAKTTATRSYLTSQERNRVLSQSRILLNIHYSNQSYFEWHRMLVALANGCCVITETSQGHGALQPGKHFVMVEPEDLIPCCQYYLAHPDECARIASQGMEFIRRHLRQDQACRNFLDEIRKMEGDSGVPPENSSIALPVDSPPYPLPSDLLTILSKGAGRSFRLALRRDLEVRTRKKNEESTQTQVTPDSAARRDIIHKREACHDRWVRQESMRQKGEPFLQFHDNPAFARCKEPELSVLITLNNYADYIEDCVGSVEKAAKRFGQSCEVLIINDASTDCSLDHALQCLRRFDLPIRVVDKKLNTGLADARNLALELARAPYVFILDADNLIYPNALLQLHATISVTDSAAAYSLLCRFERSPSNRIGLLSYFDWDPEILVQFPYIDAMAMFRRDVLREPPGYDHQLSQIGWFGWEDYDMWLRLAKKQHRVAFVPNILCLYRYHATSMISTTILFRFELVQHFITNYRGLLEQFGAKSHLFGIDREELFLSEKKDDGV
jgi:glycosyltransferase involved in cell wall biosynthesis